MRSPTAGAKTNSHLKLYLKPSKSYFHFVHPIYPLRKPLSPCDAQTSIVFLHWTPHDHPFEEATPTELEEHRPEPFTPFLTWRKLEEAIPTLHSLASRGQEPALLKIRHLRPLRPQPFHLLREECPLILLNIDTRRGDHRLHLGLLLRALRPQYVALQLRGPGLQALESRLDLHSLIIGPLSILSVLLTCHRKPSSNDLWSPCRPLRAIQIVEPNHFIPSYILTSRSCDSSRSFGIHLDYSRGTISSTL